MMQCWQTLQASFIQRRLMIKGNSQKWLYGESMYGTDMLINLLLPEPCCFVLRAGLQHSVRALHTSR